MTDKQIIIDGIDVSGCEFLRNCIIPDNYGCKIDDSLCCDVGKCYYKQLKRKEQECEELKEKYLELKEQNGSNIVQLNTVNEKLDQLKAENKELKRYKSLFEKARDLWNEASKTNYKLLDEIEDLKDSLKRTICQSECYRYKEAEKLKQTITEIKEIAEDLITITDEYDNCYHKDECDKCLLGIDGNCQYIKVEQILQKISEVEK